MLINYNTVKDPNVYKFSTSQQDFIPSHAITPKEEETPGRFPYFQISAQPFMDSRKPSNKITEIVRLQQVLKKWKKLAVAPKKSRKKSINSLKRTVSFSDTSALSSDIPKGFFAVCVGEEMKRFVIPTEYLSHQAFDLLLKEAEEEFGFQQEGVLKIPCEVSVFESILMVVKKKEGFCCCSSEAELAQCHHPQNSLCR